MHRAPALLRRAPQRLMQSSAAFTQQPLGDQVSSWESALWRIDAISEEFAQPQLSLGPLGTVISPFGSSNRHLALDQQAFMQLTLKDDQGEKPQGDKPAENPRNDVPPVGPDARPGDVPPSPDQTNTQVNKTDYSAPGTKNDPSNSRNPAGGTSEGNNAHAAVAAAQESWVHVAPVETLLETPLSEEMQQAAGPGKKPTGIEGVDDNPPGHTPDPQVIPDKESEEDTAHIEKMKEDMKRRKDETGAPNQGIQSGDDKASGGGKHGKHV